jgi:hypothetical protein
MAMVVALGSGIGRKRRPSFWMDNIQRLPEKLPLLYMALTK